MNVHKNARLTPRGRKRIVLQVESGQTPEAVAQAVGVCPRVAGETPVSAAICLPVQGLQDRSSRPHRLRQPSGGRGDRAATPTALWSRPNRSGVMNAKNRASSSISISKSSAASAPWAIASPGDIPARSIATTASVGSLSMSASIMPHGSRSCWSWPISARRVQSLSWRPPSLILQNVASGSSA